MDTQWHSHDGPDELSNGIALEPTAHKLFDVGAWSLSDDRRIIVSSHLTGTDETITRIRGHHGEGNHLLAKEKLESRFSRKELEGLTIDQKSQPMIQLGKTELEVVQISAS